MSRYTTALLSIFKMEVSARLYLKLFLSILLSLNQLPVLELLNENMDSGSLVHAVLVQLLKSSTRLPKLLLITIPKITT